MREERLSYPLIGSYTVRFGLHDHIIKACEDKDAVLFSEVEEIAVKETLGAVILICRVLLGLEGRIALKDVFHFFYNRMH